MLKTVFALLFTVVLSANNSSCSDYFKDLDTKPSEKKLTYKAHTGTQKDRSSADVKPLDTQTALDEFLASIPSRNNSNALPDFDASTQNRVGIISSADSCKFTPEVKSVTEYDTNIQINILNVKTTTAEACAPADTRYPYFILVFDKKDKPISVLTEDKL